MAKRKTKSIRNRIIEHRRIKASDLLANPANWREHPPAQAKALRGILEEVGQVSGLLAYHSARNHGALTLIDGHLRADLDPSQEWDVAVTDLDDEEADKILLTHDPMGMMATANKEALEELAESTEFANEALRSMVATLTGAKDDRTERFQQPEEFSSKFEVVIECRDERQQRELYERLTSEGLPCRVLTV